VKVKREAGSLPRKLFENMEVKDIEITGE